MAPLNRHHRRHRHLDDTGRRSRGRARHTVAIAIMFAIVATGCGEKGRPTDGGNGPDPTEAESTTTTTTTEPRPDATVDDDFLDVLTEAPAVRLSEVDSGPANVPNLRAQLVATATEIDIEGYIAPEGFTMWVGEFEIDADANPLPFEASSDVSMLLDRGTGAVDVDDFDIADRVWIVASIPEDEPVELVISSAGSEAEIAIPDGDVTQDESFSRTVQRTAMGENFTAKQTMTDGDGDPVDATLTYTIDEASIWNSLPGVPDAPAGSGLLVLHFATASLDYDAVLQDSEVDRAPGAVCTVTSEGVASPELEGLSDDMSDLSVFVVPLTFTTGELNCPNTFTYTLSEMFDEGANSGTLQFDPLIATIDLT